MGRRLRPFSLFHRIVLEEMNHPVITGAPLTPEDLILAVKVLASESIEEVLTKPTFMDAIRWRLMRLYKPYYDYCVQGLSCHVKESCAWPEVLQKSNSEGDRKGVPWIANVVSIMVKHGMSLKEVLHSPEGQIIWLYVCIGISEGADTDIMSSELEKELQQAFMEQQLDKQPKSNE